MKKKNILACFTVLSFIGILICSCNEDKGNYDYTEIDGVKQIVLQEEPYTVQPGENFKVSPEIEFVKENPDAYSYKWYAYPLPLDNDYPVADRKAILVGTERDLDFPMTGSWANPTASGKYLTFMLEVTNDVTGVSYWHEIQVAVNIYTKSGYVLLTKKKNNTFDLDVVAKNSNKFGVYTNILAGRDELDLTATPYDIAATRDMHAPAPFMGKNYGFYLLTDKYSVRLHPDNYSYEDKYNMSNMIEDWSPLKAEELPGQKIVVRSALSNGLQTRMHFYTGTDWYFYSANLFAYFNRPVNRDEKTMVRYNAAPYISVINASTLLFNNDTKEFMVHTNTATEANNFSRNLNDFVNDKGVPEADIANANYRMMFKDTDDPNQKLIYMKDGFAIFKGTNADPRYRCVIFTQVAKGINMKNGAVYRAYLPEELNNLDIKYWAFKSDTNGGMIFAATDTDLYSLNLKGLPRTYCADKDAKYEIGAAEGVEWQWSDARFKKITGDFVKAPYTKISCIKKVDDNTTQAGAVENGRIVLATYNPDGEEGANGQIQILDYISKEEILKPYNLNVEGGTTNTFTGMGEVITVTYKL